MNSDSGQPSPPAEKQFGALPAVVNVATTRRMVLQGARRHVPRSGPEQYEVMQFRVEFAGPVPARAQAPVLWIGAVQVPSVGSEGASVIDFEVRLHTEFDGTSLLGETISVAWTGTPRELATSTPFIVKI